MSDDKLSIVDAVAEVAADLNGEVTVRAYEEHRDRDRHPRFRDAYEAYDGWKHILREAGIDHRASNQYSKDRDECIYALQVAAEECGNDLTVKEFQTFRSEHEEDLASHTTFYNNFDGFNDAKEEAGLSRNPAHRPRNESKATQ